jgi:hypothetical protein
VKKSIVILSAFLTLCKLSVHGQMSTQLWSDYIIQKNISSKYAFENDLDFRTGLNLSNGWWSLGTTPELERAFGGRFAAACAFSFTYTRQQASYETWEVQPALIFRYKIIDRSSFLFRTQAKFEYRNLYNIETSDWEHDTRARLKLETLFLIHGESLKAAENTYGIASAENFWTMDRAVEERYANRLRLSAGVGRRINMKWTVECIYIYQFSKNTIEGEIQDNQQQVFRVRIKHSPD